MKWKTIALTLVLLLPLALLAQNGPADDGGAPPPPPSGGMPPGGPHGHGMGMHHDGGKWWQNSDVAQKLQLSNQQISQLDQIFLDHKMKLIDDQASVEKQDLKLQSLLDQDSPDDKQVSAQVDQVLASRGQLEREYTMMHLALRKVLTVDQWRQLKSMEAEHGPGRHMGRGNRPGPGGPGGENQPPPPGPGI
jgi:Spy/CpxP family protein refolding chaperone